MSDKIREAFEEEWKNKLVAYVYSQKEALMCFTAGYKAAQEEIERLEILLEMAKEVNDTIEDLKCCGNCKHLPDNSDDFIIDFTFCETCTRNKYHIGVDVKSIADNWEARP